MTHARKRRARPGIGVASLPMREVVFTPSDVEEMAVFMGAPLEFMPGLAAVCKLAYFAQLPRNWSEIRAHSWRTPPPPELAIGTEGMLYMHAASGRLRDRHPHDAFYRVLVKCVLRTCTPDDVPFRKSIMRFNVTDDMTGLRKTYFYNFEQHEVVGTPANEEIELLADDEQTAMAIAAFKPTVERFAVTVITEAWTNLRTRLQFKKLYRISQITRAIHARKIQRAWRRRKRRHGLIAWDNKRTLKIQWKVWWKQLANSPNFAFRLRVVRARRRVAEAEGGGHGVAMGRIELSGPERAGLDNLARTMAVLEGRLTQRYLWELEKQEKADAIRVRERNKINRTTACPR